MKINYFILPGLFLLLSISLTGQEKSVRLSINESPIEGQFQYVSQRSDDVEDFKMIKRWHFHTLKNHVLDTLKVKNKELAEAYRTIHLRQAEIDSLTAYNSQLNNNLGAITSEKEQLVFMGIAMHKSSYNKLVWTIIVVLISITVIALMLFKRSNVVTVDTQNTLEEVRAEFEAFRKRALQREEGIVRKYHSEINKLKANGGQVSKKAG